METLTETLSGRVEKLIKAQKGDEPLNSATPLPVVVSELARRCKGLEHALREIAADVDRLSASHHPSPLHQRLNGVRD